MKWIFFNHSIFILKLLSSFSLSLIVKHVNNLFFEIFHKNSKINFVRIFVSVHAQVSERINIYWTIKRVVKIFLSLDLNFNNMNIDRLSPCTFTSWQEGKKMVKRLSQVPLSTSIILHYLLSSNRQQS